MVGRSQPLTRIQLGEAKRRYEACDGFRLVERSYSSESENSETDSWLDYARDCEYISNEKHAELTNEVIEVGKMLGSMLNNPTPFLLKPKSDD